MEKGVIMSRIDCFVNEDEEEDEEEKMMMMMMMNACPCRLLQI